MTAASSPGAPPGTVIRNKARRNACLILGGLSAAVALGWLVSAFLGSSVGARVVLTLIFAVLAGWAYYASRACVVVSDTSVTVRNPFRRLTVPISQVSKFEVDSHFTGRNGLSGRNGPISAVWLLLASGPPVRCVGATSRSNYKQCANTARQLNAALGQGGGPGVRTGRAGSPVVAARDFAARLGKKPEELTEDEWERFTRAQDAGL